MRAHKFLHSFNRINYSIKYKMELQPIVVKEDMGKQIQNEIKSRLLSNRVSHDVNFKASNINNCLENPNFTTNGIIKEDLRKFSSLTDTDKLKLSSNIGSADSTEFALKSVDVVVDIHRECKEESLLKNEKQSETGNIKFVSLSSEESQDLKAFSKTDTFQEKTMEKVKINLTKQQNLNRNNNNIKVVDSIELIEEFESSSLNRRNEKGSKTARNNNTLTKKNQSFIEEELNNGKQWVASNGDVEGKKGPGRKRWSKNTSVIQLPETRDASWTSVSLENKTPLVQNVDETLSTAQLSLEQKSKNVFGIDNVAFEWDNREILQIEAGNNREDMRIQLKETVHEVEYMKVPSFINKSVQSSSGNKNKSFKGTSVRIENLNESLKVDDQSIETLNDNAILDIVHLDDVNHNKESSRQERNCRSRSRVKNDVSKRKKNLPDYSNTSQSLMEITKQIDSYSSEGTPMENDRNLIDIKCKVRSTNHVISETRHSQEYSLNAIDDDNVDTIKHSMSTLDNDGFEVCSRQSYDELQLKKFILRTKKSKFTEHQSRVKQKKDKKRRVRGNINSASTSVSNLNAEKDSRKKKKKTNDRDKKYISVAIHRADMLEVDYVAKHPMVKVHIVNIENGKYLKNNCGSSAYLQPMITGKFDFKENKSIIPTWEEELIFEHDFDELLNAGNEQPIVLFEIVDLLNFAEASFNYDKFGHEGCWYKIAWAFLKPIGSTNMMHINKKVRLQLYKPRKNSKRFERFDTCEVYTWWKSNNREKYPSSLFVTIKAVDPPKLKPVFYRQLSLHDLSNGDHESQKASTRISDTLNLPKWTRLAAQSCKIPNKIVFETEISENGCFYVVFSNDGKYLACSFSEEHDYPIIVYEVETKKIHVRFSGHKTFVYSLNWSNNDNFLLSVSSDQTARIWDVKNQIVLYIEMMPHPSYVYCGKFDPGNSSIVITGCYDRIARIWIGNKRSENYDLSQELEGHEGFINSMCFQKNSNLLTADSAGIIILWIAKKSRRLSYRKEWYISRKIKVREIDGIIINTIVLHPLESRLLVHSRNNELRMLDLATGTVLQKYNELNNHRIQSTACISPCGGLIFCGGEDSSLNVWSLETGNLIAKYMFDRNYRAVTCVDYHPYDHVLAFTTFGSPSPVRILQFNKNAVGEDIGLKIIGGIENKVNNGDVFTTFLNMSITPKEKSQTSNERDIIEEASKESSFQSSQTYDSRYLKLSNSAPSENDKYNNAKIKLHRLNEVGQSLKSHSVNRLYNIIEKIDRILLNTSRSSADIESARNTTILRDSRKNQILTNLNENVVEKKKGRRKVRSAYLSMENQSNSYFESSITSSDKRDVIQLNMLQDVSRNNWNTEGRLRNANGIKSTDICTSDMSNNSCNSPMNCERIEIYDKFGTSVLEKPIDSDFIVNTKENNPTVTISHQNDSFSKDDTSSSDSAGTYILESNTKRSNKNSNNIRNDILKHSGSASSLLSNATFTIDNELTVLKTKKKNKSCSK